MMNELSRMLKIRFLFWISSILIGIQSLGSSKGELTEKWMEQPQDHFDPNNRGMWLMRYFQNDEFFYKTGPIFILIGGEHEITSDFVEANFLFGMARTYGAMMYHTEHRYYGKSQPVSDTSFNNLKYLNVRQALADVALFIEKRKQELNNRDAFVIVLGASYAGNLAAWMRIKYGQSVQGALAISAPVHVKADFFEFYEFVGDSLREYNVNCAIKIKEAFSAVDELVRGPVTNSVKLKDDFNLCNEPDLSQPSEISLMMLSLAEIFAGAVLYNEIEKNGNTTIDNLCVLMTDRSGTSPYYKLTEAFIGDVPEKKLCINLEYKEIVNRYLQTSWESEGVADRLWLYQTCTELGFHMTSSAPESIFGSLFPLQYFMNLCKEVFTEDYNPDILNDSIWRLNCIYNSQLAAVRNIIFTNGNLDPWHKLSVLRDLNDDSSSIFINETSHCQCFYLDDGDTDIVMEARHRISFIISQWLSMNSVHKFHT